MHWMLIQGILWSFQKKNDEWEDMIVDNYIENNPSADVLMNSIRDMGYSFEAAIADVIDNNVAVKF